MEANYLKGLLLMFLQALQQQPDAYKQVELLVLQMQVNLNQIILMLIGAMIPGSMFQEKFNSTNVLGAEVVKLDGGGHGVYLYVKKQRCSC
jgi:hypothetical protein